MCFIKKCGTNINPCDSTFSLFSPQIEFMNNYFLTVSGSKDKSHGQFMEIRVYIKLEH